MAGTSGSEEPQEPLVIRDPVAVLGSAGDEEHNDISVVNCFLRLVSRETLDGVFLRSRDSTDDRESTPERALDAQNQSTNASAVWASGL